MIKRLLRRYRVQLALRLVGIAATVGAAAWLVGMAGWVPAALVGLVAVAQGWALVRTTERTPRDLLRFLEALRYDDLSLQVSAHGRGPMFEAIAESFAEVTEAFRQLRTRSEEHTSELQSRENLVCRLLLEKK